MRLIYDTPVDYPMPRRGDLLATAAGSLYCVLKGRKVRRKGGDLHPRYCLDVIRARELTPEQETAFVTTAKRRGGRLVFDLVWNPRKKKARTFEQLMRGGR